MTHLAFLCLLYMTHLAFLGLLYMTHLAFLGLLYMLPGGGGGGLLSEKYTGEWVLCRKKKETDEEGRL